LSLFSNGLAAAFDSSEVTRRMNYLRRFAFVCFAALGIHQPSAFAAEKTVLSAPKLLDAESCKALVGAELGSATIESAEWVDRGDPMLGLVQRATIWIATRGGLNLDAETDLCHVTAVATPVPGSRITIAVWLPSPWSGKLLGIGGAGFNGSALSAGFFAKDYLAQGYALWWQPMPGMKKPLRRDSRTTPRKR
jgi:hypothetical protein